VNPVAFTGKPASADTEIGLYADVQDVHDSDHSDEDEWNTPSIESE